MSRSPEWSRFVSFLYKELYFNYWGCRDLRKGNRKVKAKKQHKCHVEMPTYFCLHIVPLRGAPRSSLKLTELGHCKTFTSMPLNQDNCADGAVDTAFVSKNKTACQIYSNLFQGRISTAVLVEVNLCKGLWPEELWWIQELSSDNHMVLRLWLVQEVIENLTSKNPHQSLLAFWAMNYHFQDQFVF